MKHCKYVYPKGGFVEFCTPSGYTTRGQAGKITIEDGKVKLDHFGIQDPVIKRKYHMLILNIDSLLSFSILDEG